MNQAIYYLLRFAVALTAIPFHESAHALVSDLLGDPTAKNAGRISMNPMAHFDLMGTVCMAVAGVGWAKPVGIDPRRFRDPKKGMALTALAGPASNLVLAYISMLVWKLLYYAAPVNAVSYYAALFLRMMVSMNIGLAVFNLIPIPPMDGSRILLVVLPRRVYFNVMRYERVIFAVLIVLTWSGLLSGPLGAANSFAWHMTDRLTGYVDSIALAIWRARSSAGV